jgi:hypothetical protein
LLKSYLVGFTLSFIPWFFLLKSERLVTNIPEGATMSLSSFSKVLLLLLFLYIFYFFIFLLLLFWKWKDFFPNMYAFENKVKTKFSCNF